MTGSHNRNDGQTMSVLFTMLLFLVFIMCALFTVLAGSKVYENISRRMESAVVLRQDFSHNLLTLWI